jgi:hypothetical protein
MYRMFPSERSETSVRVFDLRYSLMTVNDTSIKRTVSIMIKIIFRPSSLALMSRIP